VDDELIAIRDVAEEHGKRKQTIFKILKRLNITPTKQRSARGRNQLVSYITQEERLRIREVLAALPASVDSDDETLGDAILAETGVFYLIQLEPDFDPTRFKVGFTTTLAERLRHLRCSAPFAQVVQTWPCKLLWEKTAIECVTAGCERLHTEVFRAVAKQQILERCKQFFVLMPAIGNSVARLGE
jgi:hypothetical protein